MGRLVAILLCVGAYALTMELTGYKIEFYDHLETIRPNEGFAACKDVIGQVIFYYKIKIVIIAFSPYHASLWYQVRCIDSLS